MGRASRAREQLLESADELIYARGYESVGVQEICRAAGVKKGSFYHFFESKRELVLEMLDRRWDLFRREVLEPAFAPDLAPLERIQRFFAMATEGLSASKRETGVVCGCHFGNLAVEMSTQDDAIRRKLAEIYRSWAGYFQAALQEAVERGDLPPFDTDVCSEAIVAMTSGIALLAKTQNSAAVADRLAPAMQAIIDSAPASSGARR